MSIFDSEATDVHDATRVSEISGTAQGAMEKEERKGRTNKKNQQRHGSAAGQANYANPLDDEMDEAPVPDEQVEEMVFDADVLAEDRHVRKGRDNLLYIAMLFGTGLLLPLCFTLSAFLVWMTTLVPNALSRLAAAVACTTTVVLYVGYSAARTTTESRLRLFSFLMTVVISMQLSCVIVFLLDTDDLLRDALFRSAANSTSYMCASIDKSIDLPVGAGMLPIEAICKCEGQKMDGNSTAMMSSCLRESANAAESGRLSRFKVGSGLLAGLLVEVILARIAWGMMVDLDLKAAKKASKKKGGAVMGYLRGSIVRGENLRSEHQNIQHQNRLKRWRRKKKRRQTVVQEISNRWVQLSLLSSDLRKQHEHKHQVAITEQVEDDASPDWSHDFGDWATYASSTELLVQVFDKIKNKPVLVGEAKVHLHGMFVVGFDYVMDGSEQSYLMVPLCWKDKKGTRVEAGRVTLRLLYKPAPNLLGSATDEITKSWYFEATVLVMVALSMTALALQSPAQPPSIVAYGAIRVLDIFLATHMTVEVLMDLSVKISRAEKWHKDPWMLIALFVLACNWAHIISPPLTSVDSLVAEAKANADEELMAEAASRGAHLEQGDVSGAMQHSATAVQDVWGLNADIDGSKTAVASRLIAASLDSTNSVVISFHDRAIWRLVSVGRVLRVLRPVRTLRMIAYVAIITEVIRESMQLIGTVCVLIGFLLSIFALIGLSSFGGTLQYECIGEAEGSITSKPECTYEQNYLSNQLGNANCPVLCPVTLRCAREHHWCAPLQGGLRPVGSDAYGFRNFDWFYRAFITTFVQTTGDGGLHTMPAALRDSGSSLASTGWLINFTAIIVLNLISVNLFLAVICSVYSDCLARAEELETQRLKIREKMEAALLIESERINAEGTEAEQLEEARRLEAAKPYIQRVMEKKWEGSSGCAEFRSTAQDIMLSPWFERATSLLIVANTVAMAMVHDDMDLQILQILQKLELGFLVCYIIEAAIKLLGCGMTIYIKSAANRFDIFVILASAVGILATYFEQEVRNILGLDARSLQSLRAVRLLRALQIVRFLTRQKALMQVLQTVFRSWKPLLVHSIFCLFSVCMFSIIGMQLLGGSLGPEATIQDYDTEVSASFETFDRGLMTVFELTVGEDWSSTMWWYTRYARIGHGYPEPVIQLIFVVMYMWMNCMLFNLYIAMLLENFSVPEREKIPTQKRMFDRHARRVTRKLHDRQSELIATLGEYRYAQSASSGTVKLFEQEVRDGIRDLNAAENKSLYLLRLDSPIRIRAANIQANPWFGRTVLVLIIMSCVALALEGPPGGEVCFAGVCITRILDWINVLVLLVFIWEAALKSMTHGFVLPSGPTNPYLASKMNALDFFIILVCLASYIPTLQVEGVYAKGLRLSRAITPMLNLSRNPDIRLVFISFARAGPDTAIIILPLVLMAIVFSILGVATFGQKLKGCVDTDDPLMMLSDDVFPFGNGTLCEESVGYAWVSPVYNFDNAVTALVALTTCLIDGAHDMMVNTTQSAPATRIYWVLFHMCFTCFFLNLFIGVLSASFDKSSGSALMTFREKQWHAVVASQATFRPVETIDSERSPLRESTCCGRPTTALWWFHLRKFCFNIATNERFTRFFHVCSLVNAITLGMETFPARAEVTELIGWVNACFLMLNAFEVMLNLVGLGVHAFFADGWHVSDMILVVTSLSTKIIGVKSGVEALRLIRVFRIFVLIAHLPALVTLIDTVIGCIRASLALILVTSIIVYLFAVLGMNMFGLLPSGEILVRMTDPEAEERLREEGHIISHVCPHCQFVTDATNFASFTSTVQLLMQISFGQGIGGFVAEIQYLGGGFYTSFVFFAVFYMVSAWVCINLLLVTVLSNFDKATTKATTGEAAINPIDMDGFAHCWAALTIGVHESPAVLSSSMPLLEHLSDTLHKESEKTGTEHMEPTTVNFEDGEPSSVGTLTIRIRKISVPASAKNAALAASKLERAVHDIRPYCKVTAVGSKTTSSSSLLTRCVELKGDEAEFLSTPSSPREGNVSTISLGARGRANFAPTDDNSVSSRVETDGKATEAQKSAPSSPKSGKSPRANKTKETKENGPQRDTQGLSLRMHITSFHTHLDFSVKDSFKFCDDWIGGERVSLEDIREKKRLTIELELRSDVGSSLDVASHSLLAGGPCIWERYGRTATSAHAEPVDAGEYAKRWIEGHQSRVKSFMASPETRGSATESLQRVFDAQLSGEIDVQKSPARGADAVLVENEGHLEDHKKMTKQRKQVEKVARQAEKRGRKLAKRHEKNERRKAKAAEKKRKRLEKRHGKMEEQEYADAGERPANVAVEDQGGGGEAEEETPHRFYKNGWRANGVRLLVTFEFEPQLAVQRTDSYLTDFITTYPHKETTSGCEGWLDVSINNGDFVRQFCYIQQYPRPRLRMCLGDRVGNPATTTAELEKMALRNNLALAEVLGTDIRSISTGAQSSSQFAITTTQATNSGYVSDSEIGMLAGTIVKATGLREARTLPSSPELFCTVEMQKLQSAESRTAKFWCLLETTDKTSGEQARLYKLHVRGIGVDGWDGTQDGTGAYENEKSIREIFSPFGEVKEVMISHRIDENGHAPQNTSWCLVAFSDSRAIDRALDTASIFAGSNVLTLNRFSEKKAAKSNGRMGIFNLGGKTNFEEAEVELTSTYRGLDLQEPMLKIQWSEKSSSRPLSIILSGDDVDVSNVTGGEDDRWSDRSLFCVRVTCGNTRIVLDCNDAVSLYTWMSSLQLAAQIVPPEQTQSACTDVARDSFSPEWYKDFEMKLYGAESGAKIVVSVYNGGKQTPTQSPRIPRDPRRPGADRRATELNKFDLIGQCELAIVPHNGAVLSGPFVPSSKTPATGNVTLDRMPKLLNAELVSPQGEVAGMVELEMAYVPIISEEEDKRRRVSADGDLHKAFLVPERKDNLYQFRASSDVIGQHWLLALRWCAEACTGSFMPESPREQLGSMEMTRVKRNVALLGLPFNRATLLLQHLYSMRVMGSHKPTRRRTMYTLFNLQLHACNHDQPNKNAREVRRAGLHLEDLRGLDFYKTLQRLSLLHYGKRRCLSFAEQVKEYEMESRHVALHMISTALAMWVFKRIKRVGGNAWPWNEVWQRYPKTYQLAVEGVTVTRLRSLSVLMQEVQRRRPPLLDVQLPPRKTLLTQAAGGIIGAVSAGIDEVDKASTCCGFRRKDKSSDGDKPLSTSLGATSTAGGSPRTPEEEAAYVKRIWLRLDKDGSGTLDADEVRSAMETLGHKKLSDSDFNALMVGLDADESGEVTYDEFMEWWNEDENHPEGGWKQQLLDRAHHVHELQQVFNLIDVDGSGRIDNDEVKHALESMERGKMPADEVARLDEVFDSLMDDTGSVGPDGFVDAMLKITHVPDPNADDEDSDLEEFGLDLLSIDTIRSTYFAELNE